jgi:hypothetical protein
MIAGDQQADSPHDESIVESATNVAKAVAQAPDAKEADASTHSLHKPSNGGGIPTSQSGE